MRGGSFSGGLVFAFFSGLLGIAWFAIAGPLVGSAFATASFAATATLLYLLTIADSWTRGLGVALLCAIPVALLLVALRSSGAVVLGVAVTLAVARSALLYRRTKARGLVTESCLVVGGLAFAGALHGSSPLALGFAAWAFFLVQSVFFLIGGVRPEGSVRLQVDPFERAAKRMEEVLAQVW